MTSDRPGGVDDDLDDVLAALADARRRRVLRVLYRVDGPVPLEQLARQVIAGPEPPVPVSADQTHCVAVRLHHVDLPKLDAVGLLAYDPDRRRVAPVAVPADVLELLDADD